jgi:hypothetical protein
MIVPGLSREGCRRSHPIPRGWPPGRVSSASEGTSVLSSIATVRAGGVRRAFGEAASRLGTKSSGPPGEPFSRQGGVQELVESASCVAARKAGSLSPAGTAGALEASAEVTRVLHGARGISVSYRSQPTGSPVSAVEGHESVSPREELTFTVCPGFALSCRSLQATLGSKSGSRLRLGGADGT